MTYHGSIGGAGPVLRRIPSGAGPSTIGAVPVPPVHTFVGKPTWRWRTRVALRVGFLAITIAGFLLVVGPVIPLLLGLRTLVVTSGSMEPEIQAGDAVLVHPRAPEEIRVGDLITFQPAGTETLETHRVVAVERIEGRLFFRTKGDANPTPDPNLTAADAILGTVSWHIPGAGLILIHGTDPRVRLVVIGLPAIAIMLKELEQWRSVRSTRSPTTPRTEAGARGVGRSITLSILVVGAITVLNWAPRPSPAAALFGEHTDVAGNDFSTAVQFGP